MMSSIDLSPLYRSSIGFDRLASLIDNALSAEPVAAGYPPYNIEVLDNDRYAITLAVAGFERHELDIKVEKGVLSVCGQKSTQSDRKFLHQGISDRTFERKFNLADHVEVVDAALNSGLLTINLVREVPEAMKPKTIAITQTDSDSKVLEHEADEPANGKAKAA